MGRLRCDGVTSDPPASGAALPCFRKPAETKKKRGRSELRGATPRNNEQWLCRRGSTAAACQVCGSFSISSSQLMRDDLHMPSPPAFLCVAAFVFLVEREAV